MTTSPVLVFNENANRLAQHTFSFSKLDVAKTCGFKFSKKYIERRPASDKTDQTAAIIGVAVHTIIENSLRVLTENPDPPTDQTALVTVQHWQQQVLAESKLTSNESEKVELFQGNITLLVARMARGIIESKAKVFLEMEIAIDQDLQPVPYSSGAFFRGKLDMVVVYPNGAVDIIDHKTSRVHDQQTTASLLKKYEDQLRAYEILVYFGLRDWLKKTLGLEIKAVRSNVAYVVLGDIIKSPTPTLAEAVTTTTRDWFIQWVNALSDRAVAGLVTRGPHCVWCEYKTLCGSKVGKGRKAKAVAL